MVTPRQTHVRKHPQASCLPDIRVGSRNLRAEPENFGGTAEIGGRDARATQIPMGEGRAFAAPKRLRPRRRGEGERAPKSEVVFARALKLLADTEEMFVAAQEKLPSTDCR